MAERPSVVLRTDGPVYRESQDHEWQPGRRFYDREQCDAYMDHIEAERDDLRAKLATAREALELYANKRNWFRNQFGWLDIYKADTNGPYAAFTALAAIEEEA